MSYPMGMENLLKLIADLRNREAPAAELFDAFTERMRRQFGACGMALLCTEGMDANGFRVLSFTDERGRRVVDDMDRSTPPDPGNIHHSEHRDTLLNPGQPVSLRGSTAGIGPMYPALFQQYTDAISLPLMQHDGVHRWLLLLFTEPGQVDRVDVERGLELSTLAINYVFSVENARRLAEANAWIRNELEAVGRIQQLLLPQDLEDTPGIRVARYFQPYTYVGGDYYEIVRLRSMIRAEHEAGAPEIWGFMIADASGHGAAAAVEIAMFDAVLRTYRPDPAQITGPGDVLGYANRYFFTRMLRGSFITAFVSSYDPVQRVLHYANAGHPRPIIKRRADSELLSLDEQAGIPLGVDRKARWHHAQVPVDPGDVLVMFTDGITEARSPAGEAFGMDRLRTIVKAAPGNADACLAAIRDALQAHRDHAPVSDDQTLLVVEIIGS